MTEDDAPAPPTPPAERPIPLIVHVLGWYGTAAILGMYLLLSLEVLASSDALFHVGNATGAAGVGLICWWRRAWPAFWLEAAWTAIGVAALVRMAL